MVLYKSKLINSIIDKWYVKAKIKDSKTGKEINFNNFINDSISIANYLIVECKIKKWDTIIAFTTNPIIYSTLVMWTIIAWWKFAVLEPSMWENSINSKIRELKPKVWFYDSLLINTPFINKLLTKLWIPNPFNIDWMKKVSIWFSFFNRKWVEKLNINYNKSLSETTFQTLDEESDAIIVFTWWTTSEPKWVVHSHRSLYNMLKEIKNLTSETNVFYADLPQFILLWIISWKQVIVWRSKYSNKKFLNIINKNYVDTIFCPPYIFNDIMRDNLKIPSSIKYLFFGSAPVYTWFLDRIYKYTYDNINIVSIYWMTEMLPIAYINWKEKIKLQNKVDWDILWYPLKSVIFKQNKDKELLLTWNHASQKYLWKEKNEFIHSWDLVEIIDFNWEKLLTLLSRKKDMIIRKEFNIYPSLYEKTINNIPFIKNAAIIWIWNNSKEDEDIILCIELEKNYLSKSSKKVKNKIYSLITNWTYSIDNFALPNDIIFIQIPCSGKQNKINKKLLKNNYLKSIWK